MRTSTSLKIWSISTTNGTRSWSVHWFGIAAAREYATLSLASIASALYTCMVWAAVAWSRSISCSICLKITVSACLTWAGVARVKESLWPTAWRNQKISVNYQLCRSDHQLLAQKEVHKGVCTVGKEHGSSGYSAFRHLASQTSWD